MQWAFATFLTCLDNVFCTKYYNNNSETGLGMTARSKDLQTEFTAHVALLEGFEAVYPPPNFGRKGTGAKDYA